MNIPSDLMYTKTHEWAKRHGNLMVVGITDYAQQEISDVVFVETPKVGQVLTQGKPSAVVESVKAAFDIYAPVSGKVTRVNSKLETSPADVNVECYGKGWFYELEVSQDSELKALMNPDQYAEHLKQESIKH